MSGACTAAGCAWPDCLRPFNGGDCRINRPGDHRCPVCEVQNKDVVYECDDIEEHDCVFALHQGCIDREQAIADGAVRFE